MSSLDYLGFKQHMVKLLPRLLVINFHHHGEKGELIVCGVAVVIWG